MRGEGPIRSAIGSLRRAAMGCATAVAAAGYAGATGTAGLGGTLAATGTDFGGAKNGAGCEPDCQKTALTMMMRLAATAARIANVSTGRRDALVHSELTIAPPAPMARV